MTRTPHSRSEYLELGDLEGAHNHNSKDTPREEPAQTPPLATTTIQNGNNTQLYQNARDPELAADKSNVRKRSCLSGVHRPTRECGSRFMFGSSVIILSAVFVIAFAFIVILAIAVAVHSTG